MFTVSYALLYLLEQFMSETLEGHQSTVCVAGQTIASLCYTDDIVGHAALEDE